jgi:VWFA-related protein
VKNRSVKVSRGTGRTAKAASLGLLVVVLASLEAGWTAVGAQDPPAVTVSASEATEGTFFDAIDVELVELEVWVRRDEQPLLGLGVDDFEVWEDDEPVALTHFAASSEAVVVADEPAPAAAGPSADAAHSEGKPAPVEVDAAPEDPLAAELAAEDGVPASAAGDEVSATPVDGLDEAGATPVGGEAAAEVDPHRLLLALYVDRTSLPPNATPRYAPALRRVLEKVLRPGDLVMLSSFEGDLVHLVDPTGDREAVVAAFEQALVPSGRVLATDLERRRILTTLAEQPGDSPTAAGGLGGGGRESMADQEMANQIRDTLARDIGNYARQKESFTRAALAGLVRHIGGLAGVPGRRMVLYVGEGIQTRAGEPLADAWRQKYAGFGGSAASSAQEQALPRQNDRSLETAIAEVAAAANAVGVTISALAADTEGVGAGVDAESSISFGVDIQGAQSFDRRQSLSMLTDPTGGTVAFRATDTAVDRLAGDIRPDYVLGYSADTSDTKRRRIEVRLRPEALARLGGGKGDKVELRHRQTRQARNADLRMRDQVAAALLWGTGANPLEVVLEPGAEEVGDGVVTLTLGVRFPLGKVVLLPRGGFHEGRLSVYVAARDEQGRASAIQRNDLPLRIPNERLVTALGQTAVWQTQLKLRPAAHQLTIGLRDEIGGVESSVRLAWRPGESEAAAAETAASAAATPGSSGR